MAQWILWKGNDTVFLGLVKEKSPCFCPITVGVCVILEKLTLRGAHILLCKGWGGTLYLCMIFQAAGRIKLGKTALLAKVIVKDGVWLCLAPVWVQIEEGRHNVLSLCSSHRIRLIASHLGISKWCLFRSEKNVLSSIYSQWKEIKGCFSPSDEAYHLNR